MRSWNNCFCNSLRKVVFISLAFVCEWEEKDMQFGDTHKIRLPSSVNKALALSICCSSHLDHTATWSRKYYYDCSKPKKRKEKKGKDFSWSCKLTVAVRNKVTLEKAVAQVVWGARQHRVRHVCSCAKQGHKTLIKKSAALSLFYCDTNLKCLRRKLPAYRSTIWSGEKHAHTFVIQQPSQSATQFSLHPPPNTAQCRWAWSSTAKAADFHHPHSPAASACDCTSRSKSLRQDRAVSRMPCSLGSG